MTSTSPPAHQPTTTAGEDRGDTPEVRALYRERAHLVAALTTHPAVRSAVLGTDPAAVRRRCSTVVYVQTDAGQLSWHLADEDLDLVADLPRDHDIRAVYDGHTTAQKYARLHTATKNYRLNCHNPPAHQHTEGTYHPMSTDTANLTVDELTAALRAQAAGSLPDEAAAGLLIEQEDWLNRGDFRRFVDYTADPDETGGNPMAWIRWADVVAALDSGDLRASGAAGRILRVAASFGGGVPVNLRETVSGSLGRAHAGYVAAAVNHATNG